MINLYYEKNTYYFYLTTTHIHDDKYMLVRSIGSANSENLLKVYIFLLAKYSRIRINTYYVMDAAKFIDKFDRITVKYGRLYPQKSEAGPIFNNLVRVDTDKLTIYFPIYNVVPNTEKKLEDIRISYTDLRYVITDVKKKTPIDTIMHSLTTFYDMALIYSANALLNGILPAYKTDTDIFVFGVKFPIDMINKKIVIRESFVQYFPLCIDELGCYCNSSGVRIDGSTVRLYKWVVPISNEARINGIISDLQPINQYLDDGLYSIVEFLSH